MAARSKSLVSSDPRSACIGPAAFVDGPGCEASFLAFWTWPVNQ